MAPTSVKVFGSPTSSEVARVLVCLFEKEVEFQLIRVDAYRGPKKMPDYLKLQPRGEALTFEDDDVTLGESRKILRHIADKYAKKGNPDLFGTGALERASIEQWLQTEAQYFDPPSANLIFSLARLPETMDETAMQMLQPGLKQKVKEIYVDEVKEEEMLSLMDRSTKELDKVLDIYEQRLQEAEYLAGDKFTLADLAHLPNAQCMTMYARSRKMIESRKNVRRWWNMISSRDAWKRVLEMQRPPSM